MQNDSSSTVKKRNAFDLQRYREIKQQFNNNSTTIQKFKQLISKLNLI